MTVATAVIWRPARLAMLAVTLAVPACAAGPVGLAGRPATLVADAPPSFSPLVKKVLPAVVNIAVTETVSSNETIVDLPPELKGTPFERQFRDRFKNRREQMQGAGSGFIIDPSGVIVTNNHVVDHADKIVVSLSDGTELPAKVLGIDDLTDIAVIKVSPGHPLPFVTWGDSSQLEVGDWIMAAGNPFSLGGSITAGIVSARGRDIGAGPFDDFLQLDAPINPGNSGGPTFNMSGQVVGVNTAIVSPTGGSVGIGFAIPSALASRIVAELRAKGHMDRGWLGVSVQDGEAAEHEGPGVVIAAVDRTGPAARAGLRAGDVVLAVNGEKTDSSRSLIRAVAAVPPGGSVRLSVRRNGRDLDLSVTVGRRPAESEG